MNDPKINLINKVKILARGFSQIPIPIMEMTELTPAAKLVWAALSNRSRPGGKGKICPSLKRIAVDVGLSRNTVQRAIQELVAVRPAGPDGRITRKDYEKEKREAKKADGNPDGMIEIEYQKDGPSNYFIYAPDWIFDKYCSEDDEKEGGPTVVPGTKVGPGWSHSGTGGGPTVGHKEEEGKKKKEEAGAPAPSLAEGHNDGPKGTAEEFLNPDITLPWEEAPEEESCPPAAPPQRATFTETEAAVKITLPKKPLKKDIGRGPSAGAVAPAARDPSGPDHSETTLARWPMATWSKDFIKAFNAQGFTVAGEKYKNGVSIAIGEFIEALGNEKLSYRERYNLLVEWLPKNVGKYKFKNPISVRFLAAKLHDYLGAWKGSSRPRKPLDLKTINFRQV